MKILYCCPFNIGLPTGKNRATRQKIEALKKVSESAIIIVPGKEELPLSRVFSTIACEIRCLAALLKRKDEIDYYISRGEVGLLSIPLAKSFGITTMREVHADQLGELKLINKKSWVKAILKIDFYLMLFINKMSDSRVFNNPLLKKFYIDNGWGCEADVVAYNGGSASAISDMDKKTALEKYRLDQNFKYLTFTGSASKWHGVDMLVELQSMFEKNGDKIRIICAGGKVSREIDPEGLLINITPLDDIQCSEVIKCAEACLLPVANNRVSPGSPLKLYDYMANGRATIAQQEMPGYSDEVERFRAGMTVDFSDPEDTREKVLKLLENQKLLERYAENARASLADYSWESRVESWFHGDNVTAAHQNVI